MNANWILNTGTGPIPCDTFPYAFRTAFNLVRRASETKGANVSVVIKGISIQGPPNLRGERRMYSYVTATQMALDQGLLTPDGSINSREFKQKRK
jgi:hypothetical protein